jgi:hypothetical protein
VARTLYARGEPRRALEALFNQPMDDATVARAGPSASLGDLVIRHLAGASDPGEHGVLLARHLRQRVTWRNRMLVAMALLVAAAFAVMATQPGPAYDLYAAGLFGAAVALAVMVLVTTVTDLVTGIPAYVRESARAAQQAHTEAQSKDRP